MSLSRVYAIFCTAALLVQEQPHATGQHFPLADHRCDPVGFHQQVSRFSGAGHVQFHHRHSGSDHPVGIHGRIQQGIMMAFLEDIWTQNFINFFASPLKIREYLSGLVMTSICYQPCRFSGDDRHRRSALRLQCLQDRALAVAFHGSYFWSSGSPWASLFPPSFSDSDRRRSGSAGRFRSCFHSLSGSIIPSRPCPAA